MIQCCHTGLCFYYPVSASCSMNCMDCLSSPRNFSCSECCRTPLTSDSRSYWPVCGCKLSNRRCRLCDEHWHAKILKRNHPCIRLSEEHWQTTKYSMHLWDAQSTCPKNRIVDHSSKLVLEEWERQTQGRVFSVENWTLFNWMSNGSLAHFTLWTSEVTKKTHYEQSHTTRYLSAEDLQICHKLSLV